MRTNCVLRESTSTVRKLILKATVHDIHVYVLTKFLPTKVVDFQPKYQSANTQ